MSLSISGGVGDQYADSPTVLDPDLGDFSWSAWGHVAAMPAVAGLTHVLLQQLDGDGAGRSWDSIRCVTPGTVNALCSLGGSSFSGTTNLASLAGTWLHFGGSVPAGSGSVTITRYINGAIDTTTSRDPEYNPAGVRIGSPKSPTSSIRDWNGEIAEVAIWSTALSDSQMAQLAAGASPSSIEPAALAAYWPLRSDALDVSGHGLDLTLSGSPSWSSEHPSVGAAAIAAPRRLALSLGLGF